jgi:hypothetical protein
MAPAFQTIQTLDVPHSVRFPQLLSDTAFTNFEQDTLDLSLFPNLLFLRIEIGYKQLAVDTLDTITTSSCIQQIVFSQIDRRFCDQLDSLVADLSMGHLPRVGLEMDIHVYNVYAPFFPRLRAKNLVSMVFLS